MGKFLIALFLLFQFNSNAQFSADKQFPVKGEPVTVTNWGSLALYLLTNTYFSETKDSIIAQIGPEEFGKMERSCSIAGWPEGFYSSDDDKGQDEKMNRLKMYKIAAYTHIFNGTVFDRYVIVRVPYSENKEWNKTVSWEGNLYFMLKEKDVRLLN